MASARFSVLDPVPLRKIDRQTRVCCNSSKYSSAVFAISDPHEGIPRQWRNVGGAIDQQIAVIVEPNALPRQWLGCRTLDLFSALLELAAVAGARDDSQFLFPGGQASEVGAHRAQREIAFLGMDDVDPVIDIERHRVERIAVRFTRVDHWRGLVEDIRVQVLIRERGGPDSGNAQRPQPELGEKLA